MRFKLLLMFALVAGVANMHSQEYLTMIEEGTYSVQEIIDNAEAYFADKDKGRGTGYKQFKRWEYTANRLKKDDGYLRTFSEDLAELERHNAYLNNNFQNGQRSGSWEELGPASWSASGIMGWNPGVGRITGISIDGTNNDHIIVGANTGGVWRTIDGGQNWASLNDDFTNFYVYSVAIDPLDSDTYYFGSSSGLIFKSTDAGGTWNQIADLNNSNINKIVFHPTNSDIIFASGGGVYRTTDGGTNWTQPVPGGSGYDVEFKPGDPSVVYASNNGVHKSTDGGATFTTISGFSSGPKMMGVSPNDDTVVYVLEAAGGSFGGLYKSTDSGDTFTELNHSGRNYFGYDTNGFDPGGQAPRDMDIAIKPGDVDEVHIAGVLTWRSLDGGVSFECTSDWIPLFASNAGRGYCHADVDLLLFEGSTLFTGTDGGIFKAENTTTLDADYYEDLTTGLGIRQFYKIGVSQTQDVVVTGGSQDNGSSVFKSATDEWRDWLGADGMEGFIDKDDPNRMYGTSQNGRMYRTVTGGNSHTGYGGPGGNGNWVTPFEQDPTVSNLIYVGYNRVYKSTFSSSWDPISQNFGSNLNEMKIAPTNNQIMYASRSGSLYRTEDGGATDWVQVTNPGSYINSIAIHPTNPNKIAVAMGGGAKVQVSDDGGTTWQSYLFNLPNFAALAVIWDDNGADALYVGMDYGVYYIDNTFTEWQPFNTNLPNVIVNEFDINNETNMIYAGTYGRGLWVSPVALPSLGVSDVFNQDTVQIYPNPTASELTISIAEASQVDIRVYNLLGRLMVNEQDKPITNMHKIDVSSLETGVYFVRINSENGTVTKRFIKE